MSDKEFKWMTAITRGVVQLVYTNEVLLERLTAMHARMFGEDAAELKKEIETEINRRVRERLIKIEDAGTPEASAWSAMLDDLGLPGDSAPPPPPQP